MLVKEKISPNTLQFKLLSYVIYFKINHQNGINFIYLFTMKAFIIKILKYKHHNFYY